MIYLRLFFEFFKTGMFAVGGGMATLPFLYKMSEKTGWFSSELLADMVAVSESTPGPIGVNMATYVGYTTGGVFGSIIATLGLITPEVIIILLIAKALDRFRNNKYVDSAFYGLRICSVALISAAGFLVFKIAMLSDGKLSVKALALALFVFVMSRYVPKINKLHPVFFILFSAAIGIIFKF